MEVIESGGKLKTLLKILGFGVTNFDEKVLAGEEFNVPQLKRSLYMDSFEVIWWPFDQTRIDSRKDNDILKNFIHSD